MLQRVLKPQVEEGHFLGQLFESLGRKSSKSNRGQVAVIATWEAVSGPRVTIYKSYVKNICS